MNKVETVREQNRLNNTIKETLSHFDEGTDDTIRFDLGRIGEIPQGVCLKLIGYGDTYNSQYLGRHYQKLLDSCLIRVVLDMSRCTYMSSTAVGKTLGFLKELKNAGGDVAVFGMLPKVREEEGTLEYLLNKSQTDPTLFMVLEKYKDMDAFMVHGGTPYLAEMFVEITPLLDGDLSVELFDDLA